MVITDADGGDVVVDDDDSAPAFAAPLLALAAVVLTADASLGTAAGTVALFLTHVVVVVLGLPLLAAAVAVCRVDRSRICRAVVVARRVIRYLVEYDFVCCVMYCLRIGINTRAE